MNPFRELPRWLKFVVGTASVVLTLYIYTLFILFLVNTPSNSEKFNTINGATSTSIDDLRELSTFDYEIEEPTESGTTLWRSIDHRPYGVSLNVPAEWSLTTVEDDYFYVGEPYTMDGVDFVMSITEMPSGGEEFGFDGTEEGFKRLREQPVNYSYTVEPPGVYKKIKNIVVDGYPAVHTRYENLFRVHIVYDWIWIRKNDSNVFFLFEDQGSDIDHSEMNIINSVLDSVRLW